VISGFARWYDERPVAGDACLAALMLLFVLPSDLGAYRGAEYLAFSLALVACVPFRRRAPVAVFAAVSLVCLVHLAVLERNVAGDFVVLIALYTVVAYGPSTRVGAAATACAVAGALIASVRWVSADEEFAVAELAGVLTIPLLLAATLGAWRRARRAQLTALRDRNRLLALERDQQAAVGAAIERARIARELHDVIAHSLSVIVVQADGAAAGAVARPAAAADALRTIADTGRDALTQMRRLLGVLRAEEGGTALAPQPGTAQLDALVGQVARAGLPARLARAGESRPLDGTIDVTLYRLAQEALTNVLKHAGEVSRVDVVLRYRDDAVELLVRDDGRGAPAADGAGHGLVGMRERVAMHDGTLEAGPRDGRGFAVRAVIPTERVAASA
jgi:signal transduction histidine kinase